MKQQKLINSYISHRGQPFASVLIIHIGSEYFTEWERNKRGKMGWFNPKKRSVEAYTRQNMATVSPPSPNFHLFMIFGIVFSLLWLSNYTAIYFQFLLMLSPILFILFLISYSTAAIGRLNFSFTRLKNVVSHGM